MNRINAFILVLALGGGATYGQTRGPGWVEGADAGSKRSSAQPVVGSGSLGSISGELEGGRGPGDFVDMYVIVIADPTGFSMSTVAADGGSVDFDSQVWLLEPGVAPADAFALLANDEVSGGPAGPSKLAPPADDGTGQTIPGVGIYLVAISGYDHNPDSTSGELYDQVLRTEISGPDGIGAADPHDTWSGAGEHGFYTIVFTGAEFVPEPVPAVSTWGIAIAIVALLAAAGAVLSRRRAAVA